MKKFKLSHKLIIGSIIALIIGLLVYRTVDDIGYDFVSELEYGDYYNSEMQKTIRKLQNYIDEKSISSKDFDELQIYADEKGWYILGFYDNKKLVFDSSGGLLPENSDELYDSLGDDMLYNVRLADKNLQMYVYIDILESFYKISNIVSVVSGSAAFLLLIMLMIRKKLKYVELLEREMHMLEDEGLDHEITVSGSDELGSLARSINDMRLAVVDRQNRESEAEQTNKDLITAVSHDLRTPLTSLLGYIELISNKSYKNEEQLEYFVSMCREKVIHIKDMTDQLFQYAYLDSHGEFNALCIDVYEYIQQVLSEMIFELESSGFKVIYEPSVFVGSIVAEPNEIARVFDNMVSNIKKYADKDANIQIVCNAKNEVISITVSNKISGDTAGQSGTCLGLKTCRRILERHGGNFEVSTDDDIFSASLNIPYKVT